MLQRHTRCIIIIISIIKLFEYKETQARGITIIFFSIYKWREKVRHDIYSSSRQRNNYCYYCRRHLHFAENKRLCTRTYLTIIL